MKLEPPEKYPVNFTHIGNLFVLDEDRDGRVTLEKLENYAHMCLQHSNSFKDYEFQYQIQAQCTLILFKQIEENGVEDLTAWIGRLLYENTEVYYEDTLPNVAFVRIETVKLLYDIMDMKLLGGFTLQSFFNLLQQSAEEK